MSNMAQQRDPNAPPMKLHRCFTLYAEWREWMLGAKWGAGILRVKFGPFGITTFKTATWNPRVVIQHTRH